MKSNNSIKKVSTIVKKGYKQALKNNKLIFQDQEKSLWKNNQPKEKQNCKKLEMTEIINFKTFL